MCTGKELLRKNRKFISEIPDLKDQPSMNGRTSSSIQLQWDSWKGNVDDDISLLYHIEYKKHQIHEENAQWKRGQLAEHAMGRKKQSVAIVNLETNTFYLFRVKPVISYKGAEYTGGASPQSSPLRTECSGTKSFSTCCDVVSTVL